MLWCFCLFGCVVFISHGYIHRSRIVELYSNSMLYILRNFQTFPNKLYHLTFSPALYDDSNLSKSSSVLVFICHFYYSHSKKYHMKSYFILIFICKSLVADDVAHLLCVYCKFVYLLWLNISWDYFAIKWIILVSLGRIDHFHPSF